MSKKEAQPIIDPGAKKILIVLGVIFAVIFGGILYVNVTAGNQYNEVAVCMTEAGTKMYGAWWCSNCDQQKAAFGASFKKIDYIECSNSDRSVTETCENKNINAYPTWEFPDGTRQRGALSIATLAEQSGCTLT